MEKLDKFVELVSSQELSFSDPGNMFEDDNAAIYTTDWKKKLA